MSHLTAIVAEPERVDVDDDLATFAYPAVTYRYSREWEVVFEDRPGVHVAYTRRGTVAYATSTASGAEPLALALALPVPPDAGWS